MKKFSVGGNLFCLGIKWICLGMRSEIRGSNRILFPRKIISRPNKINSRPLKFQREKRSFLPFFSLFVIPSTVHSIRGRKLLFDMEMFSVGGNLFCLGIKWICLGMRSEIRGSNRILFPRKIISRPNKFRLLPVSFRRQKTRFFFH